MHEHFKQFKPLVDLINQVFEIEKKAAQLTETNSIQRNINRIKDLLQSDFVRQPGAADSIGLYYDNPIGEAYSETRTDCEASIAGDSAENLQIVEVIRPIIRLKTGGITQIVQQGVVVAASKS